MAQLHRTTVRKPNERRYKKKEEAEKHLNEFAFVSYRSPESAANTRNMKYMKDHQSVRRRKKIAYNKEQEI